MAGGFVWGWGWGLGRPSAQGELVMFLKECLRRTREDKGTKREGSTPVGFSPPRTLALFLAENNLGSREETTSP
jgi:hypothetical protein